MKLAWSAEQLALIALRRLIGIGPVRWWSDIGFADRVRRTLEGTLETFGYDGGLRR